MKLLLLVSNLYLLLKEVFATKASFFLIRILLIAMLSGSTFSCISVKPTTNRSAKTLYTTFYLGDKGTQYFIKPLLLENDEKESVTVDFTFRDKIVADSSLGVINMSVLINETITDIDSIAFYSTDYLFSIVNVKTLYKEKKDKQILIRTSGNVSTKTISYLFKETNWQVKVYSNTKELAFQSVKKTNKSIPLLHSAIFELLAIE